MAPRRLIPFCTQMFPEYISAPHIQLVAEALEAVERGEIKRLILSMPPRHGKSQLTSIFLPAWYLGRNPDKRVILCAHTADLSEEFSRQARNLFLDTRWPFPKVALAKDSQSVTNWNIQNHRGGFTAAGIGGPITGKGANLLLIDDPIKNEVEASSKLTLEKHWAWYRTTLYTRQEQDASIIVTMTRWNEGDLAGRVLEDMRDGGEQWTEIRLPALAESGDPLDRLPGEALWPGKYDEERLATMQRTMGAREWNALYQQRPVPDEGLTFHTQDFRYFESLEDAYVLNKPEGDKAVPASSVFRFFTVDPAISERETADFTAILHCGITPDGDLLILDVFHDRVDGPKLEKTIETWYNERRPESIYIESVAFQSLLFQNIKRRLRSTAVLELKPDRDKQVRAMAVAERVSAGQVYLRKTGKWVGDFLHECATFPAGRHDDQVDAFAYAGKVHAARAFGTSAPYARKRMSGWSN